MPRNQLQPSEEDFAGWLNHPVTQALHIFLLRGIEQAKEDFLRGRLSMSEAWESGMKQAHTIGRCEMAETILNLEPSQLRTDDGE